MSLPEVVVYIWLGQAFFGMLPWNIDEEFAQKVRDGSVAYDLLRPVDLYAFWYSHALAYRTRPPHPAGHPSGVPGSPGAPPPRSGGVGFRGSAVLGIGSALWRVSRGGGGVIYGHHDADAHFLAVDHLRRWHGPHHAAVVTVFAGMVIPLPLFPDWMQLFLRWQPFRGLVDVPFRIYSGNIPPAIALLEIISLRGYGWDVSCGWAACCSHAAHGNWSSRADSDHGYR